jgi:hypothetical protein
MSFIPDLSEVGPGPMLAVGWLHPDHLYSSGAVPPGFSERVKEFARLWFECVKVLNLGVAAGVHMCEFCDEALGTGEIGVPAGDRLFYAPQMIAHYVEKHRYAPPAEFVDAVLASPLPGTPEYSEAVKRFVLD